MQPDSAITNNANINVDAEQPNENVNHSNAAQKVVSLQIDIDTGNSFLYIVMYPYTPW